MGFPPKFQRSTFEGEWAPAEYATFSFYAQGPQPSEANAFENVVWIPSSSFAALALGEVVDVSDPVEPFDNDAVGYGAMIGLDTSSYIWRWPRTIRITPMEGGTVRIEIQVGPAVSSGSGPVEGEGDVLIVTGSLGVGCGVDSEIDRNFKVLPFCQSVWETTGGLEHLDPAIVH